MAVARLSVVCADRGPAEVARKLDALAGWIGDDLRGLEDDLSRLERRETAMSSSAHHLLDSRGKHLRPACVILAARLGTGLRSWDLAVAAELMHSATLLHDDVIDLGERRRGRPAARLIYGNAASVLAGDWLLVEALKRIQRSGSPELLSPALSTLDEMIAAESIQLDNRGRLNLDREDYFRVVDGKTAALFRWAMRAGATAGGLPRDQRSALERYGTHLGAAFQLTDDLLDVQGDPQETGKSAFQDLREGKMTYPLLLALERDPLIKQMLERRIDRRKDDPLPLRLVDRVRLSLRTTESLRDCRARARLQAEEATACLAPLPDGQGRSALAAVAALAVDREG